jgi:CxxC-x17-CxxC domain-containing protein
VYQDKTLTCIDCGADFTFTVDEQEFYASHQLTNEPKRCKPCREKRKSMPRGGGGGGMRRGGGGGGGGGGYGGGRREDRPRFKIVCAACGREDEVPFEPKEGREVYCRDCFSQRRG